MRPEEPSRKGWNKSEGPVGQSQCRIRGLTRLSTAIVGFWRMNLRPARGSRARGLLQCIQAITRTGRGRGLGISRDSTLAPPGPVEYDSVLTVAGLRQATHFWREVNKNAGPHFWPSYFCQAGCRRVRISYPSSLRKHFRFSHLLFSPVMLTALKAAGVDVDALNSAVTC